MVKPREHGTPEGYEAGCTKDTSCPAYEVHGMSCESAYYRHVSGERRYMLLRGRGLTSTQIAQRLGFTPTIAHEKATTREAEEARFARASKAQRNRRKKTTMPKKTRKPSSGATYSDRGRRTTEQWTAGLTTRERTEKITEIRQWCRDDGFPGTPTRGQIPQDALAAYDAAHPAAPTHTFTENLDETRNRIDDTALDNPDATLPGRPLPGRPLDEAAETLTEAATVGTVSTAGLPEVLTYTPTREDIDFAANAIDIATNNPASHELTSTVDDTTEQLERARNLAARLEQELAHTEAERDRYRAAMIEALIQWGNLRDELDIERIRTAAAHAAARVVRNSNYAIAQLRRREASQNRRGTRR